jgi:hypothetical protein
MTAEIQCSCVECGAEFSAVPEGGHRLLCGDSTVVTDVERVLAGVTPHLMATDPPYGVNYDPALKRRLDVTGARSSSGSKRRGRRPRQRDGRPRRGSGLRRRGGQRRSSSGPKRRSSDPESRQWAC